MLAKFQLSNQHLSHLSQPLQYIPVMNTTQGWKPNNSNDGILGTPLPWNYGVGCCGGCGWPTTSSTTPGGGGGGGGGGC